MCQGFRFEKGETYERRITNIFLLRSYRSSCPINHFNEYLVNQHALRIKFLFLGSPWMFSSLVY